MVEKEVFIMKIYLVILESYNDGECEDYERFTAVISAHTSKEKALDIIRSYDLETGEVETDDINEEDGIRTVVTAGFGYNRWTYNLYYVEMEIDKKY